MTRQFGYEWLSQCLILLTIFGGEYTRYDKITPLHEALIFMYIHPCSPGSFISGCFGHDHEYCWCSKCATSVYEFWACVKLYVQSITSCKLWFYLSILPLCPNLPDNHYFNEWPKSETYQGVFSCILQTSCRLFKFLYINIWAHVCDTFCWHYIRYILQVLSRHLNSRHNPAIHRYQMAQKM